MKDIVAKVFGKETAEDAEIVAFYEDVQKIAMEEYAIEYHKTKVKNNDVLDLVSKSFTDEDINSIGDDMANDYCDDVTDPVWKDIREDSINAIKAFINKHL